MTTVVKNIVETQYPISEETIALFKKIGALKHLPTAAPRDIRFELHNTTTAMANALRRCMNSEVIVLIMWFEDDHFECDDRFIVLPQMKKNIGLIPVRQISDARFSLDVHNTTTDTLPVYSRSIKEEGKDGKELMFSETFLLAHLAPSKRLTIRNIGMKAGVAYLDGAAHSFEGKVLYRCLDLPEGKVVPSSMSVDPTAYLIHVPRQQFVDPAHIVKMAIKTLDTKVAEILRIIEASGDEFYTCEKMEIKITPRGADFTLIKETYTVGNLLTRYGMNVDPTITNIHCVVQHPSHTYITVSVTHEAPRQIMIGAIGLIRGELERIASAF